MQLTLRQCEIRDLREDDVESLAANANEGIATEAVQALTQYSFEQFDPCRIFAVTFAGNARSAKVLENAGYQREGILRKAVNKDGRVLDVQLYAAVVD